MVPGSPFPVPGSPFPVPGSPFPVPGSWFPVLRARFPVLVTVGLAMELLGGAAVFGAQGPDRRAPMVRVEASDEAMGTTFSVVLYGGDRAALEGTARAALDEAIRLDNLLSNYKPDSEWSAVNREAGRRPFVISAELFELFAASLAYSRATDGAFDITVGPLMRAWGFFRGEGTLPDHATIERARAEVGYRHLRLDDARRTAAFDRPGLELDAGGIGKGYAVDRMIALIDGRSVPAAFISAGGSSLYARGAPPDEPRGWRVPIRAPDDPARAAAEVFLKDASLSTSGGYEKFFRAGGRPYSHIMDPRTGHPAAGTSSVSVLAPRAIDSEAWTKAFFVNGRAWTVERRPAGFRVFMCDDRAPAACDWIE
jgi:thiamine biosynthesis lipoprotein